MPLHHWLGLSGIDSGENKWATYWGKLSAFSSAIVAFLVLNYWAVHARIPSIVESEVWFNIAFWSFFAVDFFVGLLLVTKKIHYIWQNWLKLLIILLCIPPLFGIYEVMFLY